MTALTPDCDPDLSTCGSAAGRTGGGVTSTVVLLTVLAGSLLLVRDGGGPGAVSVLAGGAALMSALVLVRRVVRVLARSVSAVSERPAAARLIRPSGGAARSAV
jgi:hypothetical protein